MFNNKVNHDRQQKPYEGLLVVAIEQAVAAPLCTQHFADGGARVVKVERAEGDFARKYDTVVHGESSYFIWANRNKESLTLNIKAADDAALLHRLISKADILVQNLAPGAMSRAGFDSDALREKHRHLITCDISGYGEEGEYRDMKAYDFLVQCESGLVAVNGSPDAYGRIGVSVCDIGASMNAIIGIQQALILRERTGKGNSVKVSLFDTAADWMTVPLLHTVYGGKSPQRVGLHHPSIAPYGGYDTADDEILAVSIQNEREWVRFCKVILRDEAIATDSKFSTPDARVKNRNALDVHIKAVFSAKTRKELEFLLREAGIAYGAVNSVETFAGHAQLRRKRVILSNGEQAEVVASPIQYSCHQAETMPSCVPKLGEHNAAIREQFREKPEAMKGEV